MMTPNREQTYQPGHGEAVYPNEAACLADLEFRQAMAEQLHNWYPSQEVADIMTDAEREENKSHSDYQYRHAAYESYVLMETMSEAMRVIVDVLIDGIDRLHRVKCENEVHRCHKCDVEHELEHAVALLDRLATAADRFGESGAGQVLESVTVKS